MNTPLPKIEDMQDILGLKPSLEPDLFWFWVVVASIAVVLLLIVLLLRRFFKKTYITQAAGQKKLSALEAALAALGQLKQDNLLFKGQLKQHSFRLTEILKYFLENEFSISAVDATTEEIRRLLKKHHRLSFEDQQEVTGLFERLDLIKFAGFTPPFSEAEGYSDSVSEWILRVSQESKPSPNSD